MNRLLPQGASLRTAALIVVAASLLLFGLIAGYSLYMLGSVVEQAEAENLAADRAQASVGVLYIADHQHGLLVRLAAIASRPSFQRLLASRQTPELKGYIATLTSHAREIASALITDPAGRVLLELPPGRVAGTRAPLSPPAGSKGPWVASQRGGGPANPLVVLGVPVRDQEGRLLGHLAVRQTTAPWLAFLYHLSARPGRVYDLFDERGGLLAAGPRVDRPRGSALARLARQARQELGRGPGPLSRMAGATDGSRAFVSAAGVAGVGWVLVVAQPYQEAMAPVEALSRQVYLFLAVLAVCLALGTMLMLALYRAQQDLLERREREAQRLESEVAKRTAELRLANDRLGDLLSDLPDMIYEVDGQGRITLVNRAVTRLLGYEPAEMIGRPRRDFVLEADREKFDEERLRAVKGERMSIMALRHLRKDGRTRWLSVHSRGVFDERGRLIGRRGVARDVTQQVLAERRVRELSRRLIGAQEEERKRLAQDLHDEMGQMLSALKIGLQGEALRQGGGGAEMERLIRLTQKVVDRLRALAYNLRPAILDSFGLGAAARDLCEALSEAGLLQVEMEIAPLPAELPPEVSLSVYRCLQEALTNVVRHSRSGWARVELGAREGVLRLVVSDHGRGFDVKAVLEPEGASRSLGLVGMRERLSLLGGELSLSSSEQGTTLVMEVPLEENHA